MTVSAESVEEIGNLLSSNCQTISDWMQGNKLKVNPEKTHLLTVGTGARLKNQVSKVVVEMDGVDLQETDSGMLLGCYVQSDLKWHKQIDMLLTKLQSRLGALDKFKNVVTPTVKKTIVEGIFTSVLSYCIPLFGGCDKGEMQSLQVMQIKAARIVTSLGIRTDRRELFATLDWMTVNQLVYYHSALSTYRIRKSSEPEYLAEILNRNNRLNKIIVPNSTLSLAMKSYCFRGANEWNRLPEEIRECEKIRNFKKRLKSWILMNVPQFLE